MSNKQVYVLICQEKIVGVLDDEQEAYNYKDMYEGVHHGVRLHVVHKTLGNLPVLDMRKYHVPSCTCRDCYGGNF